MNTGAAPKPEGQRRRRNATPQTVKLPAAGRPGDAPKWPIVAVTSEVNAARHRHEIALWREMWATPQAVEWERSSVGREVALYVRWKIAAEYGSINAAREARQLSDRLGLTPMALLRLRWEIVDDVPTQPGGHLASVAPIGGRGRPLVVDE